MIINSTYVDISFIPSNVMVAYLDIIAKGIDDGKWTMRIWLIIGLVMGSTRE